MKPADKSPGSSGRPRKNGRGGAAKCPICAKPAVHAYRPFCSKACAEADLGHWLTEKYAVHGTPGDAGATPDRDD